MSAAEDLYRQALALSEGERSDLAARLLESLGRPPGVLVEGEPGFDEEVERRAAAFEAGAPGVPAAEAFAAARARR